MVRPIALVMGMVLLGTCSVWASSPEKAATDRGAWMYEPCDRDVEHPDECIADLLKGYPGDGAGWLEQGVQLSKALVAHTIVFFQVAAKHRQQFDTWLRDLGDNTFSTFVNQGTVEAELQHAYLGKLRDLMIEALRKHPATDKNHDLATKALARAQTVKVSDL